MDHKLIGGVSVHRSRSQMATVKAMTITVDSLLPRSKLDYDVGYNAAAKGASVVVNNTFQPGFLAKRTGPLTCLACIQNIFFGLRQNNFKG